MPKTPELKAQNLLAANNRLSQKVADLQYKIYKIQCQIKNNEQTVSHILSLKTKIKLKQD